MAKHAAKILCLFFVVSTCQGGENLISNGSFDQGDKQWHVNVAADPADMKIMNDGTNPVARITNSGGWSHYYHGVRQSARSNYVLTFRAKAASEANASIGVSTYRYGKKDPTAARDSFLFSRTAMRNEKLTGQWREFSVEIERDEDLRVNSFVVAMLIRGDVLMDDVRLVKAGGLEAGRTLYLSFDEGLDGLRGGSTITPEAVGQVDLSEGVSGAGGAFVDGGHLVLDASDIFDQKAGTIAFWTMPTWGDSDGKPHCFVEVAQVDDQDLDSSFLISKGFSDQIEPNRFYFYNSPNHYNVSAANFGFQPSTWTHVAVTWSMHNNEMKVFRDGQLVAVRRFTRMLPPPSSEGRKIIIGARQGRDDAASGSLYGVEAFIDEFMIYDRVLGDSEIAELVGSSDAAPRKETELRDGSHLNKVELNLRTPHMRFANPLALPPIKTLLICPFMLASRDVVELAQRFEMDFSAVTVYSPTQFEWRGYARGKYTGVSPDEKTAEILKRLDEDPSVLVLANVRYSSLPKVVRNRIKLSVTKGMGLVAVFPDKIDPELTGARIAQAGQDMLAQTPLAGMVETIHEFDPGDKKQLSEIISVYRHGEGRVALVSFTRTPPGRPVNGAGFPGLAPPALGGRWSPQYEHRYNYYLSAVAKAIAWAGKAPLRASWRRLPVDGKVVEFASANQYAFDVEVEWNDAKPTNAELEILLTGDDGREELSARQEAQLVTGVNRLPIALNLNEAGLKYLTLVLRINGKVENWAAVSMTVTGVDEIASVETARLYYRSDDEIDAKVVFRRPLSDSHTLLCRVRDSWGRVHAQREIDVDANTRELAVAIGLANSLGMANRLEILLCRDGQVVCRTAKTVFMTRRDEDRFISMAWCGLRNDGIGMVALRQLRDAGFNAIYHWGVDGLDFHNDAYADLMPVQYCTRISRSPGKDRMPTWNGIEDAMITNPKVIEKIDKIVENAITRSMPLGPPMYSLGDENHDKREMHSPYARKFISQFLRERYGDISQLNEVYCRKYRDFDQVADDMPDGLPARIDRALATDAEWAEFHHALARRIIRHDPGARVGAEGSKPGDLDLMLQGLGMWAPYSNTYQDVLLRSLGGRDIYNSHWWGGYGTGATDASQLWTWLLRGFANFNQWFSAIDFEGLMNADFSYRPYFQNLLPELREILAGPATLLSKAEVLSDDQVAIHYSRLSEHASAGFSSLGSAQGLSGAMLSTLEGIGRDMRFISSRQIREGRILESPPQVLFLAGSYSMCEQEAAAISEFVRRGGTAVAILPPGVVDEFGRSLTTGRLDEVFGITCAGRSQPRAFGGPISLGFKGGPVEIHTPRTMIDGALRARGASVLAAHDSVPLATMNPFGKGWALMLNFDLTRFSPPMRQQLVKALLAQVDCYPEYVVTGPPGSASSVLRLGDVTVIGLIEPENNTVPISVKLPEAMHVYDMRAGASMGHILTVSIEPEQARRVHVFSLQSQPAEQLAINCPSHCQRGDRLVMEVALRPCEWGQDGRIIRMDVFNPQGATMPHYRQIRLLTNSQARLVLPFAHNDQPGKWTITITDVATGVTDSKNIEIQ